MGRRIFARRGNGQFVRPPSLEAQGLLKVCDHCGQIVPRPEMKRDEATGFVDPRVDWPKDCPRCSEPLP